MGLNHSTVSSVLFFCLAVACAYLLGRISTLWSRRCLRPRDRRIQKSSPTCMAPMNLSPDEQREWMSAWFAHPTPSRQRAKHLI
jgi:hypothetical protein